MVQPSVDMPPQLDECREAQREEKELYNARGGGLVCRPLPLGQFRKLWRECHGYVATGHRRELAHVGARSRFTFGTWGLLELWAS
eukprot:scaffold296618_cov28-Tisochrysis_lutea.AAC.3